MTSPLKNVSVEDLEKAIAEALQKISGSQRELTVTINDAKFGTTTTDLSLSVWRKPEGLSGYL
ncbi:hypothetical protein [Delftia acidovorans]|uniref:Uncharacterized protein n=1 Tax=Delftia acidovorans TaxID=80866 RepID=A0AAJ2R586_DELAC|nr:hypothetical protein [Delftia acidovorans]MDX4955900.1 hypothetical protein [Delftia acidovorans]